MEANGSAEAKSRNSTDASVAVKPHSGVRRYGRGRRRVYWGILVFVVAAGLPMVGAPSLRFRLRTRIQILREAAMGVPAAPVPAMARIGDNREPFPKEYEHPSPRPAYLPKAEPSSLRQPVRIVAGAATTAPPAVKVEPQLAPATGGVAAAQATPEAGGEPEYKKGKSEQEAYDLLVGSNQTLAAMIKGNDPKIKFQDWGAAGMGGDSYYVMVTFVQTADNVALKYIWSVKVAAKEVVPLSSLARSISK